MKSVIRLLAAVFASLALAPYSFAAEEEQGKRPIDFFDKVEIDFTASDIKAIGENADKAQVPAERITGRFVLFVPKVREEAKGFWETQMVRFASMSLKAGEYSWPLSGVSASIQFIDDRPMRMIIGRRPGGRDAVLPGSQDFAVTFTRESRSANDYSLEFSSFAFGIFGQRGIEYVAGKGDAKIRVVKTEKNEEKKKPPVDFGFSIGSYTPE
ncbi:MAG: hypothetical protein AAF221_05005 [Pseudomonadota bacterium]